MKQQVVLHIGGGVVKENYKNFFSYFWKSLWDTKTLSIKKWHKKYEENLGENFKVLRLNGKNKHYADYNTWKLQFEEIIIGIKTPIILVGHSLGGTFILKYLNENIPNFQISNIFLVAPGFKDSETEVLGSFNFDKTLQNFKGYLSITKLYHSKDDPIVPFSDSEDIISLFPSIKKDFFKDRSHFIGEEFPEIFEDIKKE